MYIISSNSTIHPGIYSYILPTYLPTYLSIHLSEKPVRVLVCHHQMLHQLQCLLYVERDRYGRWTRGKGLFAKLQQSCWRNRGGVYLKYSYTNSKNYFFFPRILIRKWACVISLLALRKVCELSVRIRNSKPQTPGMGRVFIQSHIYGVPTAHTDEDYVSNHHAHPLPVLPTTSLSLLTRNVWNNLLTSPSRRPASSIPRFCTSLLLPLAGIKLIICDNLSNSG